MAARQSIKSMQKTPQKTKGERTREKLLEQAIKVFGSMGFHNAKVEDVVKAAGLAKGTIYQYFKSKDEILTACLEVLDRRVVDFVHGLQLPQNLTPAEFSKAFQEHYEKFFELYRANIELFRLAAALRYEIPLIGTRIDLTAHRAQRHYERLFQMAKERGFLKSDISPRSLAFCLVCLASQSANHWALVQGWAPHAEIFGDVVRFTLKGLEMASIESRERPAPEANA